MCRKTYDFVQVSQYSGNCETGSDRIAYLRGRVRSRQQQYLFPTKSEGIRKICWPGLPHHQAWWRFKFKAGKGLLPWFAGDGQWQLHSRTV